MIIALVLAASASAPAHLPVQARLLDALGVPVEDPTAVTFSLYTAPSGGSALYSEMLTVDPQDGYFSVFLGQVTPLDWSLVDGSAPLYLGITLPDIPEYPRQPIGTVPFAAYADLAATAVSAQDANTVEGLDVDGIVARVATDYPAITNPYTDADAVSAMGSVSNSNPLHHNRYADADAVSAMGSTANTNPLNHTRYTNADAVGAMGSTANTNTLNHTRYTNSDAVGAMGSTANTNPLNHTRYANSDAVGAMGSLSNSNPLNHSRYTDTEARSTVASEDRYVRNTGDDVTGTLSANDLTADVDVTAGRDMRFSGLVYDDDSNIGVHLIKMRFGRGTGATNPIINFTDANGTTHTVDITNGAVNNGVIAYVPGSGGSDGALYFNIESSPSLECTLLHAEDDAPLPGFYYATDGGNQWGSIWGNTTTRTFAIKREGEAGSPLNPAQAFAILCF